MVVVRSRAAAHEPLYAFMSSLLLHSKMQILHVLSTS